MDSRALTRRHTRPRRSRCLLSTLATLGLACGTPEIEKPPAPDMRALVDIYESPTADFDAADTPELVAAISIVDDLLERTSLRRQLVDVLDDVLDEAVDLSADGNDPLNLDIEADGYMRITRICDGWTSPATPNRDQNGALLVTATFSERGLDPILWGSAESCRYLSGDLPVELGQTGDEPGAVSVYWGETIEQGDLAERALLIDMSVEARLGEEVLALDFDFRSLEDGTIEYRILRGEGSVIAAVGNDERVTIRAANGDFQCDAGLACELLSLAGAR